MQCESLFSGRNKKNIISLSSVEFAHSFIYMPELFQAGWNINPYRATAALDILIFSSIFSRK